MRRKSLFEDDGPQDISEALMTMSSSQAKPYPPGVLPEPSPQLKRRGSAYRSMKKKKDKSKPYPKRKGSFRRFAREDGD